MVKAVILAAAIGAIGCGPRVIVDPAKVVDPPPRADEALNAIVSFYGMTSTPRAVWYGKNFDCPNYEFLQEGECVIGTSDDGLAVVSTLGGAPIHATSLAHELGHVAILAAGGDGDENHASRYYRNPGEDTSKDYDATHGLVGKINAVLEASGM